MACSSPPASTCTCVAVSGGPVPPLPKPKPKERTGKAFCRLLRPAPTRRWVADAFCRILTTANRSRVSTLKVEIFPLPQLVGSWCTRTFNHPSTCTPLSGNTRCCISASAPPTRPPSSLFRPPPTQGLTFYPRGFLTAHCPAVGTATLRPRTVVYGQQLTRLDLARIRKNQT